MLSYHIAETEQLKKLRAKLLEENEQLKLDNQLNDITMQKSVQQNKQLKQNIKQVRIYYLYTIVQNKLVYNDKSLYL